MSTFLTCPKKDLPNPAGIDPRHLLPRFAAKRFAKLRIVSESAQSAKTYWCVGIDLSNHAQPLRRHIRAPLLGEADEEPLFGSESVNELWIAAFFASLLHRRESDPDTTVVRCVFTEREAAIQMNVIHHNKLLVLIRKTTRPFVEFLAIGLRPPVHQIALAVKLASLIIKPVS